MTTIPLLGAIPDITTQTESEYNAAWDTLLGDMNPYASAANALAAEVEANAAAAAAAADGLANLVWVSGTTYATGDVRYSPVDFYNYRRKTNGAGTTDPSLDTTNWALLTATANGGAEAQSSAVDITLTSSNLRVQAITMTAQFKHVILPSPGTLQKGGPVFVIKNAGSYRFGVRNSVGELIARVDAGATVDLYLLDISANDWLALGNRDTVNAPLAGQAEVINALASSTFRATRLTDTAALGIYWDGTNAKVVVLTDDLDGTTSVGTPVTVTGTSTTVYDIAAISSTEVVLAHRVGTATQSIVITISGTVPSIGGSPATIDASSSASAISVEKVSSSRAHVAYNVSTNLYARVVDVSAGVTSAGAQSAALTNAGGSIAQSLISSTQVLVVWKTGASNNAAVIYDISGTTTTASGTGSLYIGDAYQDAVMIDSTTAAVFFSEGGSVKYQIFTRSGSTLSTSVDGDLHVSAALAALGSINASIMSDGRILLLIAAGYDAFNLTAITLRCDDTLIIQSVADLPSVSGKTAYAGACVLVDNRTMLLRKAASGYAGASVLEVPVG